MCLFIFLPISNPRHQTRATIARRRSFSLKRRHKGDQNGILYLQVTFAAPLNESPRSAFSPANCFPGDFILFCRRSVAMVYREKSGRREASYAHQCQGAN